MFGRCLEEGWPRYPRLVAHPFDILVRRGAARSERVTALLDRMKESGGGRSEPSVQLSPSI